MMIDLAVAWGQVVEHLRAEADWRAGHEVEVLCSYRYAVGPMGHRRRGTGVRTGVTRYGDEPRGALGPWALRGRAGR